MGYVLKVIPLLFCTSRLNEICQFQSDRWAVRQLLAWIGLLKWAKITPLLVNLETPIITKQEICRFNRANIVSILSNSFNYPEYFCFAVSCENRFFLKINLSKMAHLESGVDFLLIGGDGEENAYLNYQFCIHFIEHEIIVVLSIQIHVLLIGYSWAVQHRCYAF